MTYDHVQAAKIALLDSMKKALTETNDPIKAICADHGFVCRKNGDRFFAYHENVSMCEYRKKNRKV